jgi:hypothetical protein
LQVTNDGSSPRVRAHSWGELDIDEVGQLGDAKLWPGGGREWDWNETGTHHSPGIQPSDVEELLRYEPEVVVLSRGRELRLETAPATHALLAERKVGVVHEETSVAITEYNRLADEGVRVAALLHSTC